MVQFSLGEVQKVNTDGRIPQPKILSFPIISCFIRITCTIACSRLTLQVLESNLTTPE
uniref:Uncharacterized protein n=1 Tax=Oryza brachyantha TaxID=4533 RepID=J3M8G9_ORYBR